MPDAPARPDRRWGLLTLLPLVALAVGELVALVTPAVDTLSEWTAHWLGTPGTLRHAITWGALVGALAWYALHVRDLAAWGWQRLVACLLLGALAGLTLHYIR